MQRVPVSFSWEPAEGSIKYMRPLDPAHFDISEVDGGVRVTSRPRRVHFAGETETGRRLVITTVDGDIESAEFFVTPGAGGVAVRHIVQHIMRDDDNPANYSLDVQSVQFYVVDAKEFRKSMPHGLRSGIPRHGQYISWGGLPVQPLDHGSIAGIDQRNGEVHFGR